MSTGRIIWNGFSAAVVFVAGALARVIGFAIGLVILVARGPAVVLRLEKKLQRPKSWPLTLHQALNSTRPLGEIMSIQTADQVREAEEIVAELAKMRLWSVHFAARLHEFSNVAIDCYDMELHIQDLVGGVDDLNGSLNRQLLRYAQAQRPGLNDEWVGARLTSKELA